MDYIEGEDMIGCAGSVTAMSDEELEEVSPGTTDHPECAVTAAALLIEIRKKNREEEDGRQIR